MKTRTSLLAAGTIVLVTLAGGSAARSDDPTASPDPVRAWNLLALDTVRVKRQSDAQAARLYAMVNVAIYDAVNGIVSRRVGDGEDGRHGRDHALVPPTDAPPEADPCTAASAAAHAVLAGEVPDQAARYDQQLQVDLTRRCHGQPDAGQAWGAAVGASVRAARAGDGSTPNETQPPGSDPVSSGPRGRACSSATWLPSASPTPPSTSAPDRRPSTASTTRPPSPR